MGLYVIHQNDNISLILNDLVQFICVIIVYVSRLKCRPYMYVEICYFLFFSIVDIPK